MLERETGLQRWAMKLELESVRQAAAAKSLQHQLLIALPVMLYDDCFNVAINSCRDFAVWREA